MVDDPHYSSPDKIFFRMKELFRQGWIGKIPSNDIESIADHSFSVASLASFFGIIENKLRQQSNEKLSLDMNKVRQHAIFHDLGEAEYLDLDNSIERLIGKKSKEIKGLLDEKAEKSIVESFNHYTRSYFPIEEDLFTPDELFPINNSDNDKTALFVKIIDRLELHFQAHHYKEKGFISHEHALPFIESTYNYLKSKQEEFLFLQYLFKNDIIRKEK